MCTHGGSKHIKQTFIKATHLQKVDRMVQQGDVVERAQHQRPLLALRPVGVAIVGFESDGMPRVVECVGDEDGLEGLFVFVVGGIAAGFAHGM